MATGIGCRVRISVDPRPSPSHIIHQCADHAVENASGFETYWTNTIPWAAAATVAGAAITAGTSGSGDTSSNQAQTQSTSPAIPGQTDALANAISQANTNDANQLAAGPYTGSLYSGESADSLAASKNAEQVAATGQGLAAQDAATGATLTAAAPAYVQNATGLAANGIAGADPALTGQLSSVASGATPVVNGALSGALNASATSAANSIAGYTAGTNTVMNSALSDPTAKLAADAGTYANSGYTNAAIAANNATIDQTLNEVTNPGLNRAAAQGGNLNSSRAGMAEAVANRDAATTKATMAANLQNNAYNSGLSTAAAQNTSGLNTALAAANSGTTNATTLALGTANNQIAATNTQDAAATAGLASGLGYQTANANTQLAANAQLGQAVNTGLVANTDAQNIGVSNTAQLAGSGALQQANTTAQDAANYNSWNNTNTFANGVLNQYLGVVNAPQFKDTTSSGSTTPAANVAGTLYGGLTTAAGQIGKSGALDGLFGTSNPYGTSTDFNTLAQT